MKKSQNTIGCSKVGHAHSLFLEADQAQGVIDYGLLPRTQWICEQWNAGRKTWNSHVLNWEEQSSFLLFLFIHGLSLKVQECEKKLVKPEESWKAPIAHVRIVKDSRNAVIKISYITGIMLKLVLHEVKWTLFVFT